jgi:hypothetical protein
MALHACPGCGRSCLGQPDDPRCGKCRRREEARPSDRGTRRARPPQAGLRSRTCLRCDADFLSEGAYHRLCEICRQVLNGGPSPAIEYRVNHPSRRLPS